VVDFQAGLAEAPGDVVLRIVLGIGATNAGNADDGG